MKVWKLSRDFSDTPSVFHRSQVSGGKTLVSFTLASSWSPLIATPSRCYAWAKRKASPRDRLYPSLSPADNMIMSSPSSTGFKESSTASDFRLLSILSTNVNVKELRAVDLFHEGFVSPTNGSVTVSLPQC